MSVTYLEIQRHRAYVAQRRRFMADRGKWKWVFGMIVFEVVYISTLFATGVL